MNSKVSAGWEKVVFLADCYSNINSHYVKSIKTLSTFSNPTIETVHQRQQMISNELLQENKSMKTRYKNY